MLFEGPRFIPIYELNYDALLHLDKENTVGPDNSKLLISNWGDLSKGFYRHVKGKMSLWPPTWLGRPIPALLDALVSLFSRDLLCDAFCVIQQLDAQGRRATGPTQSVSCRMTQKWL